MWLLRQAKMLLQRGVKEKKKKAVKKIKCGTPVVFAHPFVPTEQQEIHKPAHTCCRFFFLLLFLAE
jgi:hypothetical protein